MKLLELDLSAFRNLDPARVGTDARYVVFHGQNAQGKTNALEAIYVLATLKALRTRKTSDLIRFGEHEATVAGRVQHHGFERRHAITFGAAGRRVEVDSVAATDLGDYFRGIRAIAFTPQDVGIATGEPARRRAWLDRAAFTAAPLHLEIVRTWKRLLDQKSAALRQGRVDDIVLDALDDAFARESARLVDRRARLIAEIQPHVEAMHAAIAPQGGRLTLEYRTAVPGADVADRASAFREQLAVRRPRERERGMALFGPQADDVDMAIDGRPVRQFGSQGQVRSTILAIKLAEMLAAERRGDVPLFLIDDVGSELDNHRKQRLIGSLNEIGAQVFATTTDPEHLRVLPAAETLWIRVHGGHLSFEST